MPSDVVLKCENVGKKFSKSLIQSMIYGGRDIAGSTFGIMPKSNILRKGEFWAVQDVDFELKRGESIGIVGPNGSGKTTLLKMLNGIFMPDKGRITLHGKVGGLIQVGAGFHPMLSGRENIYINGAILGLTKREIDANFDSIVDFADIGDFLDSPVKFYSSGMYVRLGFAIAIHCRPDILLIDEILAVGDLKFQSKCLKYLTNTILKNGCSIIFVSHNRYAVEDVCEKAIYVKKGRMLKIGKTLDVIDSYLLDIKEEEKISEMQIAGSGVEQITKVLFMDKEGNPKSQFKSGEEARIRFYYDFKEKVMAPSFGITFFHNDPRYTLVSSTDYILNFHSGYDGFEMPFIQGVGYVDLMIDCLYIPVGIYKCSAYLFSENKMNLRQKYDQAAQVEIIWSDGHAKRSLVELPHRWSQKGGRS
jgi:ABC-type polysaccharide/polyol phosphate transport system ATPase subunit